MSLTVNSLVLATFKFKYSHKTGKKLKSSLEVSTTAKIVTAEWVNVKKTQNKKSHKIAPAVLQINSVKKCKPSYFWCRWEHRLAALWPDCWSYWRAPCWAPTWPSFPHPSFLLSSFSPCSQPSPTSCRSSSGDLRVRICTNLFTFSSILMCVPLLPAVNTIFLVFFLIYCEISMPSFNLLGAAPPPPSLPSVLIQGLTCSPACWPSSWVSLWAWSRGWLWAPSPTVSSSSTTRPGTFFFLTRLTYLKGTVAWDFWPLVFFMKQ